MNSNYLNMLFPEDSGEGHGSVAQDAFEEFWQRDDAGQSAGELFTGGLPVLQPTTLVGLRTVFISSYF